jgi:hypothetical protein
MNFAVVRVRPCRNRLCRVCRSRRKHWRSPLSRVRCAGVRIGARRFAIDPGDSRSGLDVNGRGRKREIPYDHYARSECIGRQLNIAARPIEARNRRSFREAAARYCDFRKQAARKHETLPDSPRSISFCRFHSFTTITPFMKGCGMQK